MLKVYLVVLDTLADWEIAYLTAELHSRRFFANPSMDFSLLKVGATNAEVRSMGGMTLVPDLSIDELRLEQDDLLLLPGSEIWDQPRVKPILEFARDALDQGHHVAAICGATVGLASVGALDARRHTSDDLGFLKQSCPKYRGETHYRKEPAVRGANLITATGLAPLEFSYEVLKMLKVWRPETAKAWYRLNKTRQSRWYDELLASMQPASTSADHTS
ncbi:type 1 glutamine amidotransferase family protein [Massilia niastensis]|uniref:type 1 glutamine amidotransferase family protein n=1 Tax=Massilia niastensis TaxID=544911 RepID=UPI00036CF405|nr:type 1 glutamine amidotransferase family protein [Massilia niastensis]